MAKTALPSTEHALYFLEDIMDRCMTRFFLLGDLAKEVIDTGMSHPLDPVDIKSPIIIGIKKNSATEYFYNTLKMFVPDAKYSKNKIEFEHLGVQVTIKIIHRKFKVLDNPSIVHYKIATYRIPNPFDKYWRQRGLIR